MDRERGERIPPKMQNTRLMGKNNTIDGRGRKRREKAKGEKVKKKIKRGEMKDENRGTEKDGKG